jgi:hypothetical protein
MTHDELLAALAYTPHTDPNGAKMHAALRSIVELHEPKYGDFPDEEALCGWCTCTDCDHIVDYPCKTIQKIQKELK